MFFLFRRVLKQMVFTALIGFVIRKAMGAENPRVKGFGHKANRLFGGIFGLDESGHRVSRTRRVGKTAGSAFVGGAVSYFFDPVHGYERRARVKTFASERLRRNGDQPPALPRGRYDTPAPVMERAVPGTA